MTQLIDKYLPRFTFNEYHKIIVRSSPQETFVIAKNLDLNLSIVTKLLLKMRGLPVHDLTLPGFLKNVCFTIAEEKMYDEFVINASQPHLKIFWNFCFRDIGNKETLVSTETRILCESKKSKFKFSAYWLVVKPFSGIIRLEMLRLIKANTERKAT
ncbi:MAG: hypothetical protein ABJA57_09840 [Ginsengibacter sp.]